MSTPKEPPRNNDITSLWDPFQQRIEKLLAALKKRGFDPIVFEALRSEERQKWLYGYGRTHHRGQKPKTWTLNSRHLVGKAVDIISEKRLWNWPEFYRALEEEAESRSLTIIPQERCHVQWSG